MIRMAQWGMGHGHAAGKARSMAANPDVELVGVYEEDASRKDYEGVHRLRSLDELLAPDVEAIAIEGRNDQALAMAHRTIDAGKHLWWDKPAGDDWAGYVAFVDKLKRSGKHLQMGYMLRYHDAFQTVADLARDGALGHVFSMRVQMSTHVPSTNPSGLNNRSLIAQHRGGILFDLGGHVLDQVVWMMGRPTRVTPFLKNHDTPDLPAFADNTVTVLEFPRALATVEISCLAATAGTRRLELHGTKASAIIAEQFEQAGIVRIVDGEGTRELRPGNPSRQEQYDRELVAFVRTIRGEQPPDRSLAHEILVQETLMRATGGIPGG